MTEKQAWLTIAEAYATPRDERSILAYSLTFNGICTGINGLWDSGRIKYKNRNNMMDVISGSMGGRDYMSRYAHEGRGVLRPANDLLRADFCYFQYYRLGGK